jgi:hypothetical protein
MKSLPVALAVAALLPAAAAAAPSMRVVTRTPLVVTGSKFHPGERVTVKVGDTTRVVQVTPLGSFKANLGTLTGDRCSLRIVALGTRGDRVLLPLALRAQCAPASPDTPASPASPVPSY